ncbi:nuclear transport factor 2 family protein [Atrimonas thermophila]|uniref:nuclear transport factor 2 family protein n=1 Tax=Atrimonas thermophila TaxID=3064161 RepID=UPI00399C5DC9
MKRLVLIFSLAAGLCLLALLFQGCAAMQGMESSGQTEAEPVREMEAVIAGYFNALAAGDREALRDYLHPQSPLWENIENILGQSAVLQAQFQSPGCALGEVSVELDGVDIQDDTAYATLETVTVCLYCGSSECQEEPYQSLAGEEVTLKKWSGQWYVYWL